MKLENNERDMDFLVNMVVTRFINLLLFLSFCDGERGVEYKYNIEYVDDLDANETQSKVEIIEQGRYEEVFSDHIVIHPESQTKDHISSSTEDIIDILENEAKLVRQLNTFIEAVGKKHEYFVNKDLGLLCKIIWCRVFYLNTGCFLS